MVCRKDELSSFKLAQCRNRYLLSAVMESGEGIIIRLTKLSDTSLIVTWCLEGRGLVKTVAKGARRAKSMFSGKIDLFYSGHLEWVESRRSELHTLREVDVRQYREGLRKSYRNTLLAGYFCALVANVMEVGASDDLIYDLLRRGLDYLENQPADSRAMEHFEKELARLTGVWDGRRRPYLALESAFGALPAIRQQCVEYFEG